ncbi:MAG: M3 family metallopeptidase [Prevotella sp.]|nr:M3 family metallopeptidase [Prevotella sp.]
MRQIMIEQTHKNPFFEQYHTLHETVPFGDFTLADIEEAFVEGIKRDDELIEKITNNPEKPTFDNTIIYREEGKEHYYAVLDKVSTAFYNLMSAETNDEMDALAQKIQPMLTKHANDVRLNPVLFERIKHVHRHHRRLTPEENVLLEDTYQGLVRSGALLDDEGKEKLRKLTEEAGMLSLQFSQNMLKENKAFQLHITDEKQLDGLPETAREAAAQAAREQEKEGWVFTLDFPSYNPFMTYCTQRELRRQMYMAKNTVACHGNSEDNRGICKRLINLRREIAQLLGYKTYADYVLERRMAGNRKSVYKLLDQLIDAYKPTAIKEVKAIEKYARKTEGNDFRMEPWDFGFYSHKLKLGKYNIDAEMLRPYLELNKVIEGVFGLANRLYGITFRENKDIKVYHPDVKAYEVFDRDGSYLAVFYADFHPRKGKQSGAWMTEYQGQYIDRKGVNVRPHVSVVMNLTKPTDEKPALLTLGEVETFLHEFGHSLHGMFANTRFESLSGTNVRWDFVELPSQFMENYAVEKEFLRTFAFHYQTGEPLPDELIDRIVKSRNFNAAYSCMRQVSFGLLDMAYYTMKEPFDEDIVEFEKKAWAKAMVTEQLPDTCMTVQFSHIMAGGYAAGYYSYKWAEVLDADAFSVFKKHGIFDQKTAQRFRDCILSKGGTEHPMILYKRFRGGEPTIKALLKRNGIKIVND